MKNTIKTIVKKIIDTSIVLMSSSSIGRYVYRQLISDAMSRTQSVAHKKVDLVFSVPNSLNKYRVDTFSTKEPETLEWIDELPYGSVLWDIGANIGLYSCYAAKARNCRVFAFEPSIFNLELLARNIFNNKLTRQVTILPLALSDHKAISELNMTTTEWGGALSTFGQEYGQNGKALETLFSFQTIGLSIDDIVEIFNLPRPDYIKMDVDGIEHLILKGGVETLKNVSGVLVEIDESFEKQYVDSERSLREAGLVLREKCRGSELDGTMCFNQIWHRVTETIIK